MSEKKQNNLKSTLLDKLVVRGHPNVLCTHGSTLEFTKEDFLTLNGDCILGINANKSVKDYSYPLRSNIQSGKKIRVEISVGDKIDDFEGVGNSNLDLSNPISMVFRKSTYICDRTALIECNKCAEDINKEIVEMMKNPSSQMIVKFYKISEE